MKKRSKLCVLSIFIFSLLFTSQVFAATTSYKSTSPKTQAVPVATVNIQNAEIVSQVDNTFTLSFEISNREIMQTGVKYGVKLVSKDKNGIQFLVDEKVYEESLTLPENTTIKKDITYVAPATFSGVYSLVLYSSNNSGFPFGISYVKDVKLTAQVKGLEIVANSCYLKVEGDKSNTHYTLLQGVDISNEEMLRLTCNTINHSTSALSLTPLYETRYYSAYGEVATTTGGDMAPIAFQANKNENFSVLLPKGATPKVYSVNISLKNGNDVSNSVSAKYVIRGVNATIANASLDKDYYQKKDIAKVSLIWTSSSATDHFIRGTGAATPALSVNTAITNDRGGSCTKPIDQPLVRTSKNPTEIPVTISSSCFNPHVVITIKDDRGTVLDQKTFDIQTTSVPRPSAFDYRLGLLILILIIIGILISMRNKRKNNLKTTLSIAFLLLVASMISFHKEAQAFTYMAGTNGDIGVTVGLDHGYTYHKNDPFSVTGEIASLTSTVQTVDLNATVSAINNTIFPLVTPQQLSRNDFPIYNNKIIPGSTSNLGQYSAEFIAGVDEPQIVMVYVKVTVTNVRDEIGYATCNDNPGHDTRQYTNHLTTEKAEFFSDSNFTIPLDVGGLNFKLHQTQLYGAIGSGYGAQSGSHTVDTPVSSGTSYTYEGEGYFYSQTDQYGAASCDQQANYEGFRTLDGSSLAPTPYTLYSVPPPPAPPAVTISANPSAVYPGENSTITWSSTYASSCTSGEFSTNNNTSGTASVGPLVRSEQYSVTCSGPGGSRSATTFVTALCPTGQTCLQNE